MHRYLIAALYVCQAAVVFAADDTLELLDSPRVRQYVRIRPQSAPSSPLEFRADSLDDGFLPLLDGAVLVAPGAVSVRLANYNPFTLSVSLEQKAEDDPSYKQLAAFLSQLLDTAKAVGFPAQLSAQAAGSPDCLALAQGQSKLVDAIEAKALQANLKAAKLRDLLVEATGYLQFLKATASLSAVRDQVRDNLAEIKNQSAALHDIIVKAPVTACSGFDVARLGELLRVADREAEAREALRAALADLLVKAAGFADKTKWRNGSSELTDYQLLVHAEAYTKTTVALALTTRDYADQDGRLVVTTRPAVNHTFVLRHSAPLVPEVAAAAIYSEVRYPRYGTSFTGSQNVVAKVSTGPSRLDAAAMLNLIWPAGGHSYVYPYLQLGVSSAKDFPGFLFGLGFRFAHIKSVSVSAGRMITWSKDLDKLHVGDPVTGTAAIDSDLKLVRAPTAWYGAIQIGLK